MIPDEYKFLTVFAIDNGEHHVARILPFGTESGSDDFMKYKMKRLSYVISRELPVPSFCY